MVTEALILTTASVIAEMIIISRLSFIRNILTTSGLAALSFSTILSWGVGFIFGAEGVTVMLGALLSTVVSWIIYKAIKIMSDTKINIGLVV